MTPPIKSLRRNLRRRLIFLCWLTLVGLLAKPHDCSAFALNGYTWPAGWQIQMHLQLDHPGVPLQDGSASWNASASDALNIWNQYLEAVKFVAAAPTNSSGQNGSNEALFSNDVYGDAWPTNVLAVTLRISSQGSVFTETDVIFNSNLRWNSYRGPIQRPASVPVWDLHRIALHEFGHVLGLAHPDENGQTVAAIMNSVIGDLDHLSDDDIAGAQAIYAFRITSSLDLSPSLGDAFTYQIVTNNNPSLFSADGLPPGLTLDSKTGIISGVPTISGTYTVAITASGASNSTSAALQIHVAVPQNLSLLKVVSTGDELPGQLVADPTLLRIYGLLPLSDSVIVIDLPSRSIIKTIAVGPRPRGLAISADRKKLWVANGDSPNGELSVIDLKTLEKLPSVMLPLPYYAAPYSVVAGSNARIYVATRHGDVVQVDNNNNAYLGLFSADFYQPELALSPDATALFSVDVGTSGAMLRKWEVTDLSGKLVHSVNASHLRLSSDGRFVYTHLTNGGGLAKLNASDLSTARLFDSRAYGSIALSADDAILYRVRAEDNFINYIDVLDTASGRLLSREPIAKLLDIGSPDEYGDMTVDATGAYLVLGSRIHTGSSSPGHPTGDYGSLQIFSTGRQNIPKRTIPEKTLVNISTRVRVGTGTDVAIAGFIVGGTGTQKMIVRGIAPSLHLAGELSDPALELYDSRGEGLGSNDNWNSNRSDVLATNLAPADEHESALVASLAPGNYTAVMRGVGDSTGIALVEAYDLGSTGSKISNISTRGKVETGDNVMIGGFIISSGQATKVVIRGIGPSLFKAGVRDFLADPMLELHGSNGSLTTQNDDWRSLQEDAILATGIAPADDRESAIVATLQPGQYTAIIRGKNKGTGVALVEVYNLDAN